MLAVVLTGCHSSRSAVKKVTEFGVALKTWSENKFDGKYTLNADKYTDEAAPVTCELMTNLVNEYANPVDTGSDINLNISSYKTVLSDWFEDDENVLITLNDIKEPTTNELETVENYEYIKKQYIFVEGNLRVNNYRNKNYCNQQ